MKRCLKEIVFLTITAICAPLIVSGAEPVNVATLRYHFAPDTTNVYNIQIENQGDSGREAIEGTYIITTKSVTGDLTGLTFKGRFRPKMIPGGPPYRPMGSSALSAYTMRSSDEMELVVDDSGNVFRQSGDLPLPVPFGQLMLSLIEKLPPNTNTLEAEREVYIMDDPLNQGPATIFINSSYNSYGSFPTRSGPAALAATLKSKMWPKAVADNSITFHKTVAVDSRMMSGSEPRVSASAEGDFVFDPKAGLPTSVEMHCKTVVITENVSRRSTATIRWKLLEGADRDAAINPPPPPQFQGVKETGFQGVKEAQFPGEHEMTAEEMAKLEKKLDSTEVAERQMAARQLMYAKISSPSPTLLSKVAELANDSNDEVQNAALTFLAKYGTQEHVVLLEKAMATADPNLRSAIIRGLGRLKDKRAVPILVNAIAMGPTDQLQYGNSRNADAIDALVRIGPAAEASVIDLLKERNMATRWQACVVLKRIGTAKSLPALKDTILAPSKELSEAAADAYRAIEAREGK